MLEINNIKFQEKFTEINIRQRMYNKKSVITLIITTEFFPSLFGENIVSGAIEAKVDLEGIKSLDELQEKTYEGDIGNITISVNNDGIWEHESKDKFKLEINKRNNRKLEFTLKTDNCKLSTTGILVSLYTTSTSRKILLKEFDLDDFYDKPVVRKIGNNEIYKYFVKE